MKRAVYFLFLINQVFSVTQEKWYESEDGSKFYIETERKYNWFQAWSECTRKHMSLIAIDTVAKHEQIDKLLKKLYTSSPTFWISGNCLAQQTRFEWASTGEAFTFTNWAINQPADVQRGEHCFCIFADFQWHDGHCSNHDNGFICEENQLVKNNCNNTKPSDLKEAAKHHNVVFYFQNN